MESWIIILFLLLISIIFIVKYMILRKDIQDIHDGFKEKLSEDTNLLITTNSANKYVRGIASELNKQLKKLQQERQCYQQGDQELKEALTNISHDIRTPLTAINGYMDLIDHENKNPKIKRYLEIIQNRIVTIEQLMNELFQYSVLVSDNEPKLEKVAINGVLEESILGFYAALKEADIVPEIHIPEKIIVREMNKSMLYRVFSNLIQNAIRYSDGDLIISLEEDGTLIFSNHTMGITQVQLAKLFNRFYTVEEARKSTGLGLSIAKLLVENMHGKMRAQYENNMLSIIIELPEI